MTFWETYFYGLFIIMVMMSLLWIISGILKNASIVDSFWGLGFILVAFHYFDQSSGLPERKMLVMCLLFMWAVRLSLYVSWRNWGKGEDFRYRQVRYDYGLKGYWWYSYRRVFLFQGIMVWIVSVPLLSAQYYGRNIPLGWLDILAIVIWLIGFVFEAGSDYQLAQFKYNENNRDKVLTSGLWKFTRHPNYFGQAAVWWAFGLFSAATENYIPLIGPALLTLFLLKVSSDSILGRAMADSKPGYRDYMKKTSSFIPWFPKE